MEYQVPQFIDVENKVVGPLTLRQFIYLAGGGGLCIIFFAYLPIIVALILSALIVALAVSLSFYKVNNKPFIDVLEAGFNYFVGKKLFLWKHPEPKSSAVDKSSALQQAAATPNGKTHVLTQQKLSELAWSLDVSTHNRNRSENA